MKFDGQMSGLINSSISSYLTAMTTLLRKQQLLFLSLYTIANMPCAYPWRLARLSSPLWLVKYQDNIRLSYHLSQY